MDRRHFLQGFGTVALVGASPDRANPSLLADRPAPDIHSQKKPVVKVCGVGDSGCTIVGNLIAIGFKHVTEYFCVTNNKAALDSGSAHRTLLIDNNELSSSQHAGAFSCATRKEIGVLVDGADTVIVIAGFGGDVEARIATHVACIARLSGTQVASILLMPFFHPRGGHGLGARHDMLMPQINSHVSMVISTEALGGSLGQQGTPAELQAVSDRAVVQSLKVVLAMTTTGPSPFFAANEESADAHRL